MTGRSLRHTLTGSSTLDTTRFDPPCSTWFVANDNPAAVLTVELDGRSLTLQASEVLNSQQGEILETFAVTGATGAWRFHGQALR